MAEFKVKFYGVRGSYPVPGKTTVKYGGNTSWIRLNINNNLIILDAGTGIIKLGTELLLAHIGSGENEEIRKWGKIKKAGVRSRREESKRQEEVQKPCF